MKIAKRVFLFITTNILIIATISIVMSVLGVQQYLDAKGINYQSLLIFCVLWGFGGAFISLALSKVMAKWMMGVNVIDPQTTDFELRSLVQKVHSFARKAGIEKMPEVGYYEAEDLNAFATGPTKNRSLVAVSRGLLRNMNEAELDGVLAHEVAHIANGDMVTMTLLQGVVNAFVMFLARIVAYGITQLMRSDEEESPVGGFAFFAISFVLEIIFMIFGSMLISAFSRWREYRADAGGARLGGRQQMISALQALKRNMNVEAYEHQGDTAVAAMKIENHKGKGLARFFSTHPDLDSRIARLERMKA